MPVKRTYRTLPVNASKGQKYLSELLEEIFCSDGACMSIMYEYPLSVIAGDEDLAEEYNVKGMSVDFYIKELSTAIEYQGSQHYATENHFFGGGQPERDSRKREFLKDIGVKLVEIPDKSGKLDKPTVLKYMGLL